MGLKMISFTCPHCQKQMTDHVGPNWTPVPLDTGLGQAVVLSCMHCQMAIGSLFIPTPR